MVDDQPQPPVGPLYSWDQEAHLILIVSAPYLRGGDVLMVLDRHSMCYDCRNLLRICGLTQLRNLYNTSTRLARHLEEATEPWNDRRNIGGTKTLQVNHILFLIPLSLHRPFSFH